MTEAVVQKFIVNEGAFEVELKLDIKQKKTEANVLRIQLRGMTEEMSTWEPY